MPALTTEAERLPDGSAAHAYAARKWLILLPICLLVAAYAPVPLLSVAALLAGPAAIAWRATRTGRDRPLRAWSARRLCRALLGLAGLGALSPFLALGQTYLLAIGMSFLALQAFLAHIWTLTPPGSSLRRDALWVQRGWWLVLLFSVITVLLLVVELPWSSSIVTVLAIATAALVVLLSPVTLLLLWWVAPPRRLDLFLPPGFVVERSSLEGLAARGEARGAPANVRIEVIRPDPCAEIRVEARGLAERWPGLGLRRRASGEAGGAIGDPLLGGLLFAEGIGQEAAAALLAGLHEEVLAVLHAWPGSSVEGGEVVLRVPSLGSGAPDPHFLAERLEEAARLAAALEVRVASGPRRSARRP